MYILLIVIAAFVQSSFWEIDFVLIALLAVLLFTQSQWHLYLAFGSGILLSYLLSVNMGLFALVFLVVALATQLFKLSLISQSLVFRMLYGGLIIGLVTALEIVVLGQRLSEDRLLTEILVMIMVFLGIRFLDERFGAKSDMRLKVRR